MKRGWLIGAVVLTTGLAWSCGDDSGGSGEGPDETRQRVALALTTGVTFGDGQVQLEPMPEATDEDLAITQDGTPIDLDPGVATLLPFEIDNNDEDDPVVATLLQFEDTDEHTEVDLELDDGETMAEVMVDVKSSICNDLCASNFAVKLIQSLKTRGGRVGKHIVRTLMLNCEERGDEAMCESADPGGDPDGGTSGSGGSSGSAGSSGSSGSSGSLNYGDLFVNGAIQVNSALCTCMGLAPSSSTCRAARWISSAESECVQNALADSANVTPDMLTLITNMDDDAYASMIEAQCATTPVLSILLPNVAAPDFTDDILACDVEGEPTFSAPAASGDAP